MDGAFDKGQRPEPDGCEQEIKGLGPMDDLVDGDDVHSFLLLQLLSRLRHVVYDNYAPEVQSMKSPLQIRPLLWRRIEGRTRGPGQGMAMRAAMVSMPSQRFCRRRFSLAACWLSSWLAMGTVMVRVLAARSMASGRRLP